MHHHGSSSSLKESRPRIIITRVPTIDQSSLEFLYPLPPASPPLPSAAHVATSATSNGSSNGGMFNGDVIVHISSACEYDHNHNNGGEEEAEEAEVGDAVREEELQHVSTVIEEEEEEEDDDDERDKNCSVSVEGTAATLLTQQENKV